MKLINASYKIIEQESGIQGVYKSIEQAGRTCYKSEDKITDNSAEEFVNRMINSKHYAMLEFGTIYLTIPIWDYKTIREDEMGKYVERNYETIVEGLIHNKYSKCKVVSYKDNTVIKFSDTDLLNRPFHLEYLFVTTNLRVLIENDWLDIYKYLSEPTEFHEKRVCVKFTCDRGVSHELVRHRVFSFAQESTRYCNYSKDKFGNEITYIIPSWLKLPEGNVNKSEFITEKGSTIYSTLKGATEYINNSGITEDKLITAVYLNELLRCESSYFQLIEHNWKPQQARAVLPNCLKTEINMCGFVSDWEHVFELRDNSHAHPDMQALMKPLHTEFKEKFNTE